MKTQFIKDINPRQQNEEEILLHHQKRVERELNKLVDH